MAWKAALGFAGLDIGDKCLNLGAATGSQRRLPENEIYSKYAIITVTEHEVQYGIPLPVELESQSNSLQGTLQRALGQSSTYSVEYHTRHGNRSGIKIVVTIHHHRLTIIRPKRP